MKYFILIVILFSIIFIFLVTSNQNETISFEDSDVIKIPINVYIVQDPTGYLTSSRNEENILELFQKADNLWSQASIDLEVQSISFLETTSLDPGILLSKIDTPGINAVMARTIGANGRAYAGRDLFLVADYTTVNDFRTTAHEIGHLLTLRHVPNSNFLMAMGRNGEFLSGQEIEAARINAEKFN